MSGKKQNEDRIDYVARKYREDSLRPDVAWDLFATRQGIIKRIRLRRYSWAAAAVLVLLVGLSGRYWMEKNADEWVAIVTVAGEHKEVWLPDSTVVTLAENSSIRYDKKKYGKEQRAVEMTGKAFFQVERDEARSFSVQTEQTETRVLGTSFQLEEKEGADLLHVETGKVRFSVAANKEVTSVLTAGMSARYSADEGLQVQEEEENINYLSWKTHRLRFRNAPLEQVIHDISDTYQVELTNYTKENLELKLTSYFDNLTLDEVLTVINQTLDIQLKARPIN